MGLGVLKRVRSRGMVGLDKIIAVFVRGWGTVSDAGADLRVDWGRGL